MSSSRRVLGDVKNITQTPQRLQPCKNSVNSESSFPTKQGKLKQQQQTVNEIFEEIEFGGNQLSNTDSFNDVLNEKQKLSNLLLNAKCIPLLPTHSAGEFSIYNDSYHTQHVLSDKKLKKNIKKEGKFQRCKLI